MSPGAPLQAASDLPDGCVPSLAPGVRMHADRLTGQPMLLFPEAMVELKGAGSAIVGLCDGQRRLGQIVAILSRRFQSPTEKLRTDVARFLHRLRDRMLIEWSISTDLTTDYSADEFDAPAPPIPAAQDSSPPVFSPRPIGLIAEVTYRCPLHCPYCSNPSAYAPGTELSTEQWCRVLAEAAGIGVLHALFSGGEPLARPDLETLIASAREAGLYTNLITSGIGITPHRAAALKDAGLDSVQISFQSDEPVLADSIAGATAHRRKIDAAKLARASGFPLTINVVLHRFNIGRVDRIVALAQELGARRLELASAQYYGWAMSNRSLLLPDRLQVQEAAYAATAAQQRLKGVMDVLYVLPDYFGDRPKPCMNGWGQRYIAVNPLGDVLPCPTAGEIKSLRFPNVRDHGLEWIWTQSDAFTRFRGTAWMPEPCRTCDRREIDFGGCRCQAALLTGDPANTDPVCALSTERHRVDDAMSEAAQKSPSIPDLFFRMNP